VSRRERRPGRWRPVFRLLPYFRPYVGRLVVLVVVAVAFAGADAGRAWLVQPLLDRVLLRSGEIRGQVEDEALAADLAEALPDEGAADLAARVDAVAPPDAEAVAATLARPDLLPEPPGPDADLAPLAALLARTTRLVDRTGDALDPADREAWRDLTWGIRLQEAALAAGERSGPDERAAAAALSLAARERVHEATFRDAWRALLEVFGLAIALALALAATHYVVFLLSRVLVARVFVDLQNRTTEHLLGLSLRFFEDERRGDLLARLTADLALVSNVINLLTAHVLIQSIQLVVLVGSAVYLSWELSLSLLVLGLGVIGPLRLWGRRIRKSARRRQGATGNVLEAMQQVFAGIRVVKGFQREDYERERFRERTQTATDAQERAFRARAAAKAWVQFVNDLTVPLLFGLGGYLVVTNWAGLDAGQFGTFLGLCLLMYMPARTLGEAYNGLNDALPAVERVFHLLDARPEVLESEGAEDVGPIAEGLAFEDVSFSYDGAEDVLRGVSFEAPVGSLTAIVGPTGSGKSTLTDLIARFHDPRAGRVLVDGRDLRTVRLDSWLGKLAAVPQDGFLFHDSVRENIRYGRLEASDAEVAEAARQARIHDEVLAQPGGYDRVVGERGGKFSGGQVQRLAIARALVKDPAVLILDEATSALDTRTERRVHEAFDALKGRTTTFVIAHRLSTVKQADQILVLEKGRLVERGTHDELLARGGVYATLIERQLERPRAGAGDGEAASEAGSEAASDGAAPADSGPEEPQDREERVP